MDQHDDVETGSFIPDAYNRGGLKAKAAAIGPSRSRWRGPAVATTVALVAALCLHTGSAAQVSAGASKPASISAHAVAGNATKTSLTGHVVLAADSAGGGVHGAFSLYDGVGGGIEFWFDPISGDLTTAIGVGVGAGGAGVIGTYRPGTAPEPGTYVYANADLSAGTVATVNVAGNYSLNNGVFVGTVNTTVAGRTLSIASDGGTTFDVSVVAAEGAAGFSGAVGVNYTFKFNIADVINYIWNAITNLFTGDYSLEDSDDTGDETVAYADDSSTDTDSNVTTDDSSGSSSDASSDDSSDSSSDAGDSGDDGGGGGGGSDDGTTHEEESVSLIQHADLP